MRHSNECFGKSIDDAEPSVAGLEAPAHPGGLRIVMASGVERPVASAQQVVEVFTHLHVGSICKSQRETGAIIRATTFMRQMAELRGGVLICKACNTNPVAVYGGIEGERAIEAHHKFPIAQLQPDSVTTVQDVIMVCATCHRVIHSQNPCSTVEELRHKLGM